MRIRGSSIDYGLVARTIHWLMAALLIGQFVLGQVLEEMSRGPEKQDILGLHQSFGVLALSMLAFRVVWLALDRRPALPGGPIQKLLARAVHGGLYLIMVAFPVSGLLMTLAGGHDVSVFGAFTIPPFPSESALLHEAAEEVHEWLAPAFFLLTSLHVLAALYHQFVLKDRLLGRMIGTAGTRA